MMLLFWGGLAVLGVFALRAWQGNGARPRTESGLDLLKARYARGEITKAEYEEIRRDLER
jgi:putative membrane protein